MKTKDIYYEFYRQEKSKKLLVVCTSINIRPPKFSFYKKGKLIGVNILFVNCDAYDWYRKGIPGIGNSIEDFINFINDLKSKYSINDVYFMGSSMGGYGAILLGTKCNAKRILACGAEPVLYIPGSHSDRIRNNYLYLEYNDLRVLDLKNIVYIWRNKSYRYNWRIHNTK